MRDYNVSGSFKAKKAEKVPKVEEKTKQNNKKS